MSSNVAFFIEIRDGLIRNCSYEAVTVARTIAGELGGTPVGIALGNGFSDTVAAFGEYGIPEIITVDRPELTLYAPELYTAAFVHCVKRIAPAVIIMTATAMGKDLAPRAAARLNIELISDSISYKINNGKIEAIKPIFAGKARITVTTQSSIQFVTIRPKVFSPAKSTAVSCQVFASDFDPASVAVRVCTKEVIKTGSDKADLTEADVIVSGGRGLQEPKNFEILEQLADTINAVVGASRAVVDAGWRPHSDQVGQTGKTVSPNLYIAVGISGAIQHLAGMSSSKCIVAVNKDPEASIFKVADYGIVGDLFAIVPKLNEEFKKLLASS